MKSSDVEAKVSNIRYGKWTHSYNDEHWPLTDGFDTKEEAIEDGKRNYEGQPFWVGTMRQPRIPKIDGDWIREHISELMHESEEAYEGRPEWPELSTEDEKKLEQSVNNVIAGVLVETGNLPDWFVVEDAEKVTPEGRHA